jgi:hypothetical protein
MPLGLWVRSILTLATTLSFYGSVTGRVVVGATMSLDWFMNDRNGEVSRHMGNSRGILNPIGASMGM